MKNGNFVAKYDWRVNKAKVFKDRKKAMKRGESKYKTIKVEKRDVSPFFFVQSSKSFKIYLVQSLNFQSQFLLSSNTQIPVAEISQY